MKRSSDLMKDLNVAEEEEELNTENYEPSKDIRLAENLQEIIQNNVYGQYYCQRSRKYIFIPKNLDKNRCPFSHLLII